MLPFATGHISLSISLNVLLCKSFYITINYNVLFMGFIIWIALNLWTSELFTHLSVQPFTHLHDLTGDEVIRKGTEGNVFYIIKEGTMRVTDVGDGKSYPDHDLGPGDYFGERALLTGEPRAANIRATSSVVLMALDRLSFDTLLGPLKDVLNQNMIIRVLNSLKFFDNLSPNMKIRLAKAFEVEFFPAGNLFFYASLPSIYFNLLHSTLLL